MVQGYAVTSARVKADSPRKGALNMKAAFPLVTYKCGHSRRICGDEKVWCAESAYDFGIDVDTILEIKRFQRESRAASKGKWMML